MAMVFGWTFVLAAPVQALTQRPQRPHAAVRELTKEQMAAVVGSQSGPRTIGPGDIGAGAGAPFPWQAAVYGVNTANGNRLTKVPIVGWRCRGRLAIDLELAHSSYSTEEEMLGKKWTHTFDIALVQDPSNNGGIWLHWGDGQCYEYADTMGTYTPPTGIFDTLASDCVFR
jgi:hypothetical protein